MTAFLEPAPSTAGRQNIYYWKCDRPAAFHGTQPGRTNLAVLPDVQALLERLYPGREVVIRDGGGQGNHLTFIAEIGTEHYFVRVENGPEQDGQLEIESQIMRRVRRAGVPTPRIHHVDASRKTVPFAWQVMDQIPALDLNQEVKQGRLEPRQMAFEIGAAIARWQSVPVSGFGHFDPLVLRATGQLQGFHSDYQSYFLLNWKRHLDFLERHRFLSTPEVRGIDEQVLASLDLLELTGGCLVHKDLAFWNILGDSRGVAAYIDWDDSVAADEMDDMSLLGCFHDGPVLAEAFAGYASGKPLPEEYVGRFWIHLLRNMIVKSVIRVGAGYFDRADGFFLFGQGMTGADLVRETRVRIFRVLEGLKHNASPEEL